MIFWIVKALKALFTIPILPNEVKINDEELPPKYNLNDEKWKRVSSPDRIKGHEEAQTTDEKIAENYKVFTTMICL